ncbi:MAG: hypothetical protein AAF191_12680 [Verrucomicrobiota bacterium]
MRRGVLVLCSWFLVVAAEATEILSQEAKKNAFPDGVVEFRGTNGRSNPLCLPLAEGFQGDELFLRYRLQYDKASIDSPAEDEGEFFVLWFDKERGNDRATHSSGLPNVGIHVSGEENRFMVRYVPGGERFGPPLVGDQEFLVVARLWKSEPGLRRDLRAAEVELLLH